MGGDSQRVKTDAIEVVNFLTQSPVRVAILKHLSDADRLRKSELKERFDVSQVTLTRNLDALEERAWIRNHVREYELLPSGELIVDAVETMLETVEFVESIQPFLRWFPEDELEFDVTALADATVVVAESTNPYAPVNRHIEAMKTVDRFRCLLPVVGLPAMTVARETILERDTHQEIIYSPEVQSTLQSDPQYRELLEDMHGCDNCRMRVAESEIRYYLGLCEERIQIGVQDDDGVPQALVETDRDAIREWATRTYRSYRKRSEPLVL